MFKALVVVRNFESSAKNLDFGEFTIDEVGLRFKALRDSFTSVDVNQDDWIFEKSYKVLPPGPPGSPIGGIPDDIEDILLLLRLYRAGDISFIKQAIIPPNGNTLVQFPYRAMNDLNSYSPLRFEFESGECEVWREFAARIRQSQSWTSAWFAAARRFFLCGGAKQFNPRWDDVDRIVDYATALEAALVPERDYNTRRISHRAARLIAPDNAAELDLAARFVKTFYEVRSSMVHGSGLGDKNREWLLQNWAKVELTVRQILVKAVQNLPPGEQERCIKLAELYDPTDEDRAAFAYQKFREIKKTEVQQAIAAKIARKAKII